MNTMNAQSIISHRMFVAALSHDESDQPLKSRSSAARPASTRGQRADTTGDSESGAAAQQLFLLYDAMDFQPRQA